MTYDVYMNIYSYVISIPNIIFTCIGTALSTVVIPIFMGHTANGKKDAAKRFADNIITICVALTAGLVLVGIVLAPILPKFTEFAKTQQTYAYATKALMVVLLLLAGIMAYAAYTGQLAVLPQKFIGDIYDDLIEVDAFLGVFICL